MKKQIKPILRFALGEVYTFLGVFSTLLTIICLIDFSELVPDFAGRIVCVVIVFAVSYGMAVIRVASTKQTVVDLENGREAVLEYGDLFTSGDRIVIPVNDSFDTLVDDVLIAKSSIHGQFVLKYFEGREKELDRIIEKGLERVKVAGRYTNKNGKPLYYPPGTVVPVRVGEKTFYLLALTHFRGNTVEPNMKIYYTAVLTLLEYLNKATAGAPVYIPLLGSGLARINREKENELANLLSILRMSRVKIVGGIHIVLHPDMRGKVNILRYRKNKSIL